MTGKIIDNATGLMPLPKSTAQASEPTPPSAGSLEIWEQTTDLNRSYLLYRRQDSAIRRLEFLNSTPPVGIPTLPVTCTTASITLYVATTGSDSNDGLTVPTAMLTIAAALNKVPYLIKHTVIINVGAGNFTGFVLDNRWAVAGNSTASLTIQGADFINYTPVGGGTGSGTATGGSTSQLIDGGQAWATNALRGYIIYVGGEYKLIRKNDATTLDTVGLLAGSPSGKAYQIMDLATVLNASPADAMTAGDIIDVINFYPKRTGVTIAKFRVAAASGKVAVNIFNTAAPYLNWIVSHAVCGYGLVYQAVSNEIYIQDCAVINATSYGLALFGVLALRNFNRILVANCCSAGGNLWGITMYYIGDVNGSSDVYSDNNLARGGIIIQGTNYATFTRMSAYGNTNAGITLSNANAINIGGGGILELNGVGVETSSLFTQGAGITSASVTLNAQVIKNNVGDAVRNTGGGSLYLTGCTGTGNGGYGVNTRYGCTTFITSATTVTGALGNATVNGVNALTWATDFAADGDSALNVADNAMIMRKDSLY
jgi:hypothetical protein